MSEKLYSHWPKYGHYHRDMRTFDVLCAILGIGVIAACIFASAIVVQYETGLVDAIQMWLAQ